MKHDPLNVIVQDIAAEMALVAERGTVADYIPDLASVSTEHFGIAVSTMDGSCHVAGDADMQFSTQSITKVFALSMALEAVGDDLWKRVGREPSGSAFNSIVQLEWECGIPRNPFINAGAIVVSDVLLDGFQSGEVIDRFLRFMRMLTGDESVFIDMEIAQNEKQTGHRNVALASYMRAFGNIHHPIEQTLDIYFNQCSLSMNCRQLALAGRFLMAGGVNPDTGLSVVSAQRASHILALMLTCSHCDASGEFAFRVGLPGKSGVGGGIIAIAPNVASIAVWSPGLTERGNSLLGKLAMDMLTQRTGWSVFEPA